MHGHEGRHEGCGCGHEARHHHGHECGCGEGEHQRHEHDCGCGHDGPPRHHHGDHACCCGRGALGPGMFRRRFIIREERIAHLEHYLHELQQEAKAVEEHLSDLKAAREE